MAALPPLTSPATLALNEFHRGMSFGYLARPGYYTSEAARRAVDDMAEHGVTWVALMITVMQESFSSTRVFSDFEFTPADAEVQDIVTRCRERGLRVMLKPMVECLDSAWRGRITFPDGDQQIQGRTSRYWDEWFASHNRALIHYARLAEKTHCELFSVGCELVGTDQQSVRWEDSLGRVREVYRGPLTYDAQPESVLAERPPAWFSSLDLIGCSFYHPAASRAGATREEMTAALRALVPQYADAARKIGRPLMFAEAGCRSATGAAIKPNGYIDAQSYSGEEQANYLEAMCDAFWTLPCWRGFYWWKWDEQQRRPHFHTDPAGDMGFTLAGKPGAAALARWFRRMDR